MTNLFVPGRWVRLTVAAGMNLLLALVCQAKATPVLVVPASEAQGDQAEDHLERGLKLARAGEPQSAETELREALRLKPNDAEILSTLATVLAIEKKYQESTALFQRALKLSPGDMRSRRHLAANLYQLRRYSEARQHLQLVLKADRTEPQARLLLGLISEKTGDYATAVNMLASFPTLLPEQPDAAVALATSYYRTGNRAKAVDCLTTLGKGLPGTEGALLASEVADRMQDYATAESLLEPVLAEFPDHRQALYRLAVVKFHARQYPESERILEGLVGTGKESGEILRLLGWCYHKSNREEDAIRTFRKAVENNPADEKNFLDLGALLLEQRKFTAALELAIRTVNAFPASADALVLMGSIEFATERFTDAVKTYSRSMALDRSNSEAVLGLARAQAAAGMGGQARTTLEEAIQQFPGEARFELQLALLLLRENDENPDAQARAEQLLQAAVRHDPTLAEAQFQLGELALRRGDNAIALAHLENAVKISPDSAPLHFALARGYRRVGRVREADRETALFEKLKKQDNPGTSSPANAPPRE
jgi:tetratricopeptide (TPR) repeat protein